RSGELVASIFQAADGLRSRRSQIPDADSLDDAICANVSFVDRFATPPVVFRGVHETVDGAWAQEDHPLVPGAAFPAPARLLASVPFEAWDIYYGPRTRCCFAYFSVLSQQGLRVVVGAIYRSTQRFHALAAFRTPDADPAALAALTRYLTALVPYSAWART
ncbi:MAG: hypothetical protein AAFR70_15735, partial [Pseudomonadota bacterium]